MGTFRRVSALDTAEAIETSVSGAYANPDGSYGLAVGDISSWPREADFITYARDGDGEVMEESRVVWMGTKVDENYITAVRTGGSESYIPGPSDFAAIVPSHRWANDIVGSLAACLPDDGGAGILTASGTPITIAIAAEQPAPVEGRTVLWLRPLE